MSNVRLMAVLAQTVLLSLGLWAQGQNAHAPYPDPAPLDQYLMADRNAEITLARSAAPKAISDYAEIMVLERQGYITAVKGTNGFVCIVERSWTAGFGDPEFWNRKIERQSASIRRPCEHTSPSPSREPSWPWRGNRKPRCSTRSTLLSTKASCQRSKTVRCATCCRSKAILAIRPGASIRI